MADRLLGDMLCIARGLAGMAADRLDAIGARTIGIR